MPSDEEDPMPQPGAPKREESSEPSEQTRRRSERSSWKRHSRLPESSSQTSRQRRRSPSPGLMSQGSTSTDGRSHATGSSSTLSRDDQALLASMSDDCVKKGTIVEQSILVGMSEDVRRKKHGRLAAVSPSIVPVHGATPNMTASGFRHSDYPSTTKKPKEEQGLAVATKIEADRFLPAAEEYDVDAKPPLYKNRRFQMYGTLCGLLLVGAIVGVVLGVVLGGGDDSLKTLAPTTTPTLAPTSTQQGKVVDRLYRIIGEDVHSKGTPAYKASQWILNEDPMQLDATAENLEQRFLLAMFYYSTTQKSDWRTCGKPDEGDDDSCLFDALGFGYNPEDGADTEFYTQRQAFRWLSGKSECKWVGSMCNRVGTVTAIEMWGNNITGPLPDMLSKFRYLQSISLAFNEFTGTIPDFTEMRHLINLQLDFNFLTGTISPKFFEVNTLQDFNVGANLLDGPINGTTELNLANLESLFNFHVYDNSLTGPFPSEIGTLKFLTFSRTGGNDFDRQPLPTEIGQLSLLQELWMDGNAFTGVIPTEIALAAALTDLRLNNNRLRGPIPEALYQLTRLELLFLEKNTLSGTLSSSIARLVDLEQIRLRENKLSGKIPSELGSLQSLNLAFLHRNLFTGKMPDEVCAMVECGIHKLQYLNADCAGESPANPCPCCTACCERGGEAELCFLTNFLDCS